MIERQAQCRCQKGSGEAIPLLWILGLPLLLKQSSLLIDTARHFFYIYKCDITVVLILILRMVDVFNVKRNLI